MDFATGLTLHASKWRKVAKLEGSEVDTILKTQLHKFQEEGLVRDLAYIELCWRNAIIAHCCVIKNY